MLLFAHTGITMGIVLAWDKGFSRLFPSITNKISRQSASHITSHIDYRLALVGSMLPDIIDKPVGHVFFNETFDNNGRIFAHTLLFFMLLLGYGLFRFYRYHKTGMLVVAACSGIHLMLDEIWSSPRTLFWPVKGWDFPDTEYIDLKDWLNAIQETASTEPTTYVTEAIGLTILLASAFYILYKRNVLRFIRKGEIQ